MGYLSEIARRRIAALILIAGVVLFVLAVTDSSVFEDPPSQEELAGDAVEEFFAAAAAGDFERYCALLTDSAREFVRASGARLIQDLEGRPGCVDIVSLAAERFEGLEARIKQVSVSGNRARVEATLKVPGSPSEFRTVLLEMDADGAWLVSDQG